MSGWQKSAYISSDELSDSLSRECNFRILTADPITLAWGIEPLNLLRQEPTSNTTDEELEPPERRGITACYALSGRIKFNSNMALP
ncbi:hypothetical protein K458DRAFT_395155 [Lentithecium fluviatile CBS 122367]|uniref:Uncharacterized protein n=1 Tax=Lentithecium fluviatile CBS 122367 TaxID=1168545 RepID=A0A6G1IJM6_9PLEO|nr:hypothetical protein K458DRAFT_395155 [Lentithecium fluviatile CBS 122367]